MLSQINQALWLNIMEDKDMGNSIYTTGFFRDENQIKQDWMSYLVGLEKVPLDIAYKAKVLEIRKEFLPYAIFSINCEASWTATSIIGHTYKNREGKKIDVVDSAFQSNGRVGPKNMVEKVWMGDKKDGEIFFKWTNSFNNSQLLIVDKEYFSGSVVMQIKKTQKEYELEVKNSVYFPLKDEAKRDVPGNWYEDFRVDTWINSYDKTMVYLGIYHIIYEYNGVKYDFFMTGGNNQNDLYGVYPVDSNIANQQDILNKEISNNGMFSSYKILYLLGMIFLPMILLVVMGMVCPSMIRGKYSNGLTFLYIMIMLGLVAGIGFCIVKFIFMQKQIAMAKNSISNINESNKFLRSKINELIQNDDIPEEGKKDTIEGWIKEQLNNYSSGNNSRSELIEEGKKKQRKIFIIGGGIICGIVILSVLLIFVIPSINNNNNSSENDKTQNDVNVKLTTENDVVSEAKKDEIAKCKIGDVIEFGSYSSKPIEWIVLSKEEGKILVLSKTALFGNFGGDGVVGSKTGYYHNINETVTWENCYLRTLLNSENFLNTIFTSGEQNLIIDSYIVNEDNKEFGTEGGNDSFDKLFLLSVSEVDKYCKSEETIYCNIVSEKTGISLSTSWWLRTPGMSGNAVTFVRDKKINYEGVLVNSTNLAKGNGSGGRFSVRPAMWLKADGTNTDISLPDNSKIVGANDTKDGNQDDISNDDNNTKTEDTIDNSKDQVDDVKISEKYQLIKFEELSFELPKDIKFYELGDGLGGLDLSSGCGAIYITAFDASGVNINSNNVESTYDSVISSTIMDYNPQEVQNMQSYATFVDGCWAKYVMCDLFVDNDWRVAVVLTVCNEDYSRMYVITNFIYNKNKYTDDDGALYEHILNTMDLP